MLLLIVQISNFNFCEDFLFLWLCSEFFGRWLGMLTQTHFNVKVVCGHLHYAHHSPRSPALSALIISG